MSSLLIESYSGGRELAPPRLPQSVPISSLLDLETPHAVVDMARVHTNIAHAAEYARAHGLKVRPHIKTHKDPIIAQLQLNTGAIGITCATPREAEVMAGVTNDILVAYPPVDPYRIERLLSLPSDVNLKVALDSERAVERLALAAAAKNRTVGVLVEVDLGASRTGVSRKEDLVSLAQAVTRASHLDFLGMMIFPGHLHLPVLSPPNTLPLSGLSLNRSSQSDRARKHLEPALQALSSDIKRYLHALQKAGITCSTVSGGGTPSLFFSHLVSELTEIRPGTYVYSDRDIASQGVLSWEDCAYSILATVISTAVPGQAVIDAGTKALAKEPLHGLDGYGALLDRPEVIVKQMNEEHGILDLRHTDWTPKVGDRVRVVPNHVCVSVHLQDKVAFVETGKLTLREVAARGR